MSDLSISLYEGDPENSLLEEAGLFELVELAQQRLKRDYAMEGRAIPTAYIVCTLGPDREILIEPSVAVVTPSQPKMTKDEFMDHLSEFAMEYNAIGVLLAFEGVSVEGSAEEVDAVLEEGPFLEEHPASKDVLVVSMDHGIFGTAIWQAGITTEGILTEIGDFIEFDGTAIGPASGILA